MSEINTAKVTILVPFQQFTDVISLLIAFFNFYYKNEKIKKGGDETESRKES